MTRRLRAWCAALLLAGAGAAAAAELEVAILEPSGGEPLFGDVTVEAQVYPPAAPLTAVELYLDGQLVGVLAAPPLRWIVDVGQDNVEHEIVVVARDATGGRAEATVRTPRVRTDEVVQVELHQLYVTVERSDGTRVLDLPRQRFTVREDGRLQEIVTFERGDVPFAAAILVDASTSMAGPPLRNALAGARSFVDGMARYDEAKLLLFSDHLRHETPFTSYASVLTVGLAAVEAAGGTAVNDHLYLALQQLAPRQGRKVVILLSDGVDVESVLPMSEVLPVVERSEVVIYWLRLRDRSAGEGGKHHSVWKGPGQHTTDLALLERAVAASGGRVLPVSDLAQVGPVFETVLRELREHYVLGYYPPAASGRGTHKVEVEVSGEPGARVRTRGRRVD